MRRFGLFTSGFWGELGKMHFKIVEDLSRKMTVTCPKTEIRPLMMDALRLAGLYDIKLTECLSTGAWLIAVTIRFQGFGAAHTEKLCERLIV
jgi:hypothetical protein